jgi:hypothetical protein
LLARAGVVGRGAVYRHVVFVALDLTRPLRPIATDLAVEPRLLRPEDSSAYARFRGRSVDEVPVARRLQEGHVCIAVWLGDEIVSAGWVAFGSVHVDEIGRALQLAPDEAYAYDSYTIESLRGRGLAAVRARWSGEYLQERGYSWTVAWISPQNRPAFAPTRKLGYDTLGIAGYLRLGPLRRDFVRPAGRGRRWMARREPILVGRDFLVQQSHGKAVGIASVVS